MSARLVCTMTVYTLFFDGACAPNPGPGAWGAVLFPGDRASSGTRRYAPLRIREATWAGSGQLGTACTSNVAEYGGLIGGLRGAVASLRTIHDLFDSADDLRGKSCVPGQSSHKATQTCLRAKTASRRLPRS